MKKTSLSTILSLIATIDTPEAEQIRTEITAELNKGKEKADANRSLYEQAKAIVLESLALCDKPVTISEVYEDVKDKLPEGFSKSKVQYGFTRYWADEVVKTEGKVNTYTLKV